ncbi:hypothetical protein SAMN04488125_107200 [Methylorubrum salsuginis]|uniref:GT-D fold-like domain-containing protein n=1 Tax=Methylorubrum salsuginis TaxID=414703 RepID=A0A1I4ECT1_9HYPH|nr:hypothetical protein SAMN04488125_107200 [Methylorubrum salsuginis]
MEAIEKKHYHLAIIHLENWLLLDRGNAEPRRQLIGALINVGRFEDANRYIIESLRDDPHSLRMRLMLASNYKKIGNDVQAVDCAKESIKLFPNKVEAYILLAQILIEKEAFAAALMILRDGLAAVDDRPPLNLLAAAVALKLGSFSESSQYAYQAYADLNSRNFKKFEAVERSLSVDFADMLGMLSVKSSGLWPRYWLATQQNRGSAALAQLTPQLMLQQLPMHADFISIPGDIASPLRDTIDSLRAVRKIKFSYPQSISDAHKSILSAGIASKQRFVEVSLNQVAPSDLPALYDLLRWSNWILMNVRTANLEQRVAAIDSLQKLEIDYRKFDDHIIAINSRQDKLLGESIQHEARYPLPIDKDSYISDDEAVAEVKQAIEAKKPFSLLRIGDGEGYVLGFDDTTTTDEIEKITRFWFGHNKISPTDVRNIRAGLVSAIRSADVIGMHFQSNIGNKFGMPRRHVSEYLLWNGYAKFCSANVHHNTLYEDRFDEILSNQDFVGLITPRAVEPFVRERFNVGRVITYFVPEEVRYAEDKEKVDAHYPDVFAKISKEISVPYQGAIFLVGAGVLGKLYCDTIKKKGGIAIDIGGVFDIWAGHKRVAGALKKIKSKINPE